MKNPRRFLLTMQYNEYAVLPVFLRHYSKHFDENQIYVIDHGSERNIVPPGVNRIHVPRFRKFSEASRLRLISNLVAGLLGYYDYGVFCDTDEIIDLTRFDERQLESSPVIYTSGYEVFRATSSSGDRVVGRLSSYFCKPAIFSRLPRWVLGFHGGEYPPQAKLLVPLLHLKYFNATAFSEVRTERRRIYASMNVEESTQGIDHHWTEGSEAMQKFHALIISELQSGVQILKEVRQDSSHLFDLSNGLHLPLAEHEKSFVDFTDEFSWLLEWH